VSNNRRDMEMWWSFLLCHVPVTADLLQSVVSQHGKILFLGNSLMQQQYFVLLCMLNPDLTPLQMTVFTDGNIERAQYDYIHANDANANANGTTGNSTTSLFYEPLVISGHHRKQVSTRMPFQTQFKPTLNEMPLW